jgi:hypothetical protein
MNILSAPRRISINLITCMKRTRAMSTALVVTGLLLTFSGVAMGQSMITGSGDQWALDQPHSPREAMPISSSSDVELTIEEAILVELENCYLKARIGCQPGIYRFRPRIRFKVRSNSPHWQVQCQASDLTCGSETVSGERLIWKVKNSCGQVVGKGILGSNPIMVSDGTPCDGGDGPLEYTIKFSIEIVQGDPSGRYRGNISLIGTTGP